MVNFWYIGDSGSFEETRALRLGSSDVIAAIPNPEKPTESLAGYGRTAVSTYLEKIGEGSRGSAGLPAEMGHYLENKSLELFIRRFDDPDVASDFRAKKELFERLQSQNPGKKIPSAAKLQIGNYRHSTEYFNDAMISHPDMVYCHAPDADIWNPGKIVNGIQTRFDCDFIVEAKSAQLFAAKRRDGSLVSGYDFDLLTWHGIPLKHYVQIQFQLAMFEIKTAYLSLIYDTSNYHVWKIEANREWQGRIIDIAGKMAKCIKDRTIPRELAMNKADVMKIYPKIEKDYVMVSGGELDLIQSICREHAHADKQEKAWKVKKEDAADAIAVHLKDVQEIKGPDGKTLAKWNIKKGATGIKKPDAVKDKRSFLKYISEDDKNCHRYLKNRGYIRTAPDSRYVSVKFKEDR